MCALVLLGVVLFVACDGGSDSNGINNDTDYELYEPEAYGAEESDNDDDNDTETTSNQTLPPTTQIQTPTVTQQEINEEIPLMWLITSPTGQSIYILGSIHAARADTYPLPAVIMNAFMRSEYLALELWPTGTDGIDFDPMISEHRSITDYMPKELYERAIEVIREHEDFIMQWFGINYETISNYHPFIWFNLLGSIAFEKSSMSADTHGIDMYLANRQSDRGGDILSIEEHAYHEEMLESLLLSSWPLMIESVLDVEATAKEWDVLYDAWRRGDYEALLDAARTTSALGIPGNYYARTEFEYAMLIGRGLQMTDRAREFMSEGKSVFFVVGVAHLVGEDGVINQLVRLGYDVVRVR